MPRYGFRCLSCGREFEVSRPMSRSDEPAACPYDGGDCERVVSMPATVIKWGASALPAPPPQQQSGWSHFGHSHGAGEGGHAHPNTP
jgi:putative FmdB family regulatory protein